MAAPYASAVRKNAHGRPECEGFHQTCTGGDDGFAPALQQAIGSLIHGTWVLAAFIFADGLGECMRPPEQEIRGALC